MSDFRTKLFGLAGLATVFAGVSFAQGVTCTGTPTLNPSPAILLRAEGVAELVSDVVITGCTSSNTTATGSLTAYLSAPITSKAISGLPTGFSGSAGNSEATLIVNGGGTTYYQGTVSGTQVSFSGVSFPATFSIEVANVRVNASTLGVTAAPVAVTETIFAGSNGLATLTTSAQTVGFALKSLVAPSLVTNSVANYFVCSGNPATSGAPTVNGYSFEVNVGELFGGAFKTQTGATGLVAPIQNGEQGSYVGASGVGTASSGTQISLTFANLPSVATVYVPLTVSTLSTVTGITASPALTIVGGTAVTSPAGPAALNPTGGGVAAYTPTSGSLTVTYTVSVSNPAQIETFIVPVYVTFPANVAAAQGPITVVEGYAPTATLTGTAPSIPLFAPTTNPALNASTISICSTSILFPFITNQSGYDTGIAIANTSTDPLGTAGASKATAQNGTCTLSFYGAGAPTPATYTTPAIGPATTPTYAFTLSGGAAPGFQGYAIAVCNFLYGHGFAFVTNSATAGSAGVAQGYLGLIVPNNSRPNLNETLGE